MKQVEVLIVGAGMAGLSAALWCKRLGLDAVVIERENDIGGQLKHIHNEIWDFPPRVYRNGADLLAELKQNEKIAQLDIRLGERLLRIDPSTHTAVTDLGAYRANYLIMATGVRPNQLPWLEHSRLLLPPRFSTSIDGAKLKDKRVLVIGGGDRAVESACNLAPYARQVWLAVRRERLRARPEWTARLDAFPNVTVLYATEALSAQDTPPTGVFLRTAGEDQLRFLEVDYVLPRIGVRGNSDESTGVARYGDGFIRVDQHLLTSADWIYAIGDVTNGPAYASLSLAAGQGMRAAKHISLRTREG